MTNALSRAKTSAGILLYRVRNELEVFLVHPGGPFWAKKDLGAWSVPKGETDEGEDLRAAAMREFTEETGFTIDGELHALPPLKQKSGKTIHAFAIQGDCDPAQLCSNTFSIEWPPKSGRQSEFPEADRGAWFTIPQARERIAAGQQPFLDALLKLL